MCNPPCPAGRATCSAGGSCECNAGFAGPECFPLLPSQAIVNGEGKQSGTHGGLIAICVIMAVVVCAAFVFLYIQRKKHADPDDIFAPGYAQRMAQKKRFVGLDEAGNGPGPGPSSSSSPPQTAGGVGHLGAHDPLPPVQQPPAAGHQAGAERAAPGKPTPTDPNTNTNNLGDEGGYSSSEDDIVIQDAKDEGQAGGSGVAIAAGAGVAAAAVVGGGAGAAAAASSSSSNANAGLVGESALMSMVPAEDGGGEDGDPTPEQLELLEETLLQRDLTLVFAMEEYLHSRPPKFAIKLAKAMVCVFEEQGSCMRLVRKMVQAEVSKTSSAPTLSSAVFLDDLLVTEVAVAHANHMAHTALSEWLNAFGSQLVEAGSLELDPKLVSEPEAMAAAEKVTELATAFIASAAAVVEDWPPSLRHVFKFIFAAAPFSSQVEEIGRIVFDRVVFVTLLNADPIKGNKELKKSVMVLAKVVKTSYRTKPLSYPAPPAVAAFVGEWADGTRAATETFLRQVVEISDDSIVEVVRQIAEDRKTLHLINAHRILNDMHPEMARKYSDDFRGKFNLREFNRHAQLMLKVQQILGVEPDAAAAAASSTAAPSQ